MIRERGSPTLVAWERGGVDVAGRNLLLSNLCREALQNHGLENYDIGRSNGHLNGRKIIRRLWGMVVTNLLPQFHTSEEFRQKLPTTLPSTGL